MSARLMMIRHWHLRSGHKPREGQDYCEGCAHEMDDLLKHMDAAGYAVVPKEPTREMLAAGATSLVNDQDHRGVPQLAVSPAHGAYKEMLKAAKEHTMSALVQEARRRYSYDPKSGILRWKINYSNRKAGDLVGWVDGYGYRYIRLAKRAVAAHRVVWMMMTGEEAPRSIDHIDGDKANNAWVNLRLATASQQQGNKVRHKNNKSGARGVLLHRGKFVARLRGKHIGTFDRIEDAKRAYTNAARTYYGEFYRDV